MSKTQEQQVTKHKGKHKHDYTEWLATKEGSTIHKEGKVNMTQAKLSRAGQQSKQVGKEKRGSVKQDKTHVEGKHKTK